MIVVADASPLNYLVQIDRILLLHTLYLQVHVPREVMIELQHPDAPPEVANWVSDLPAWVHVHSVSDSWSGPEHLDRGEAEAIQLAELLHAELLLIDDRRGRQAAEKRGIATTGTLGVLVAAAQQGLVDAEEEFRNLLRRTKFRVTPRIQSNFITLAASLRKPRT